MAGEVQKPQQELTRPASSHDLEPGVAQIKAEFVIPHDHTPAPGNQPQDDKSDQPPPSKKRRRGQNKHRPRAAKISFSEMLCPSLHNVSVRGDHTPCYYGDKCRYMHDVIKYMSSKLPDIGNRCYMFDKFGKCPYGVSCRFASSHITSQFINIVKEGVRASPNSPPVGTCNVLSKELQECLRKRKIVFERSDVYLKRRKNNGRKEEGLGGKGEGCGVPQEGHKSSEEVGGYPGEVVRGSVTCSEVVTDEATCVPPSGVVTDEATRPNQVETCVPPSGVVTDEATRPNQVETCVPPSGVVTDEATRPNQVETCVPPSGVVTDEATRPNQVETCVPPSGVVTDEATRPNQVETCVPPSGVVTDEATRPNQVETCVPPSGVVTDEATRPNQVETCVPPSGVVTDEGIIPLRPNEKKKIDFRGKLYLAPLTTTGNLPFRRICKEFGADITCGEMAMCTNLLQGQQSEWALLKRHQSEDFFGVQVCGAHMDTMTKCAELINTHTSVDFVDINTGCPIDLVFKKGAGAALMGRSTRFEGIVRGMHEVLDFPLTVKMRAGIYKKNWNAHKLIPKLREWGVSMVTVHGRSREQRYTKRADWDYIKTCVEAADPMPIFGNGDILSFEDYDRFCEGSNVAGTMIARGALIKPWIFTEIKENRHWDIRSSERLDILHRYANYGLEHWGSDTLGVENTRKFLLEWLSFLYRYIPVGLLERVPQKINQRPPSYRGRDDLETLMASDNCRDWIKISEMLLGPAPDNFLFVPKHRANAYNQ